MTIDKKVQLTETAVVIICAFFVWVVAMSV